MSTLYDIGRRSFLTEVTVGAFTGQTDWVADDFQVVLVDLVEYPLADVSNHTSMADVPLAARVAEVPLTNTVAQPDGTAATSDLSTVFPNVTGAEVGAVIIYRANNTATPVDADNVLIAYIDSAISGLPVDPNGGDITVLWNGGDGRIFRL